MTLFSSKLIPCFNRFIKFVTKDEIAFISGFSTVLVKHDRDEKSFIKIYADNSPLSFFEKSCSGVICRGIVYGSVTWFTTALICCVKPALGAIIPVTILKNGKRIAPCDNSQ